MVPDGNVCAGEPAWFTNETSHDDLTEHYQYFRVPNWVQ